jgi:hypothetical protein
MDKDQLITRVVVIVVVLFLAVLVLVPYANLGKNRIT